MSEVTLYLPRPEGTVNVFYDLGLYWNWSHHPQDVCSKRAHRPRLPGHGRCRSTFFFITLKPRVECYKSLWALNTSPPRNLFTFLRSRSTRVPPSGPVAALVQGYLAHKKLRPPPRIAIGP